MNIVFLGTGTPDWFSSGGSSELHEEARRLGGRNWRCLPMLHVAPSCLIDFPCTAPRQMRRHGVDRSRIEHLLVTHSHRDHFDPAGIAGELKRPDGLRHVYGNEVVCREVRRALGGAPLPAGTGIHLVEPFRESTAGDLKVIPLKANHCHVNENGEPETALNFILRTPNASLLYLVDTRLMYQETHEFIRTFSYDGVIIDATFGAMPTTEMTRESGHLNFDLAMSVVNAFRNDGILPPKAPAIFTHISTARGGIHREHAPQLARKGFTLAYDGMRLTVGGKAPHRRSGPSSRQPVWIWGRAEDDMRNFYLYARKRFVLHSRPEKAVVQCSCVGSYQLYVNGHLVGRGPSPCDPGRQYVDTHDVAPYLRDGENVLAALCHSLGEATECATYQNPGKAGFFMHGEIRCKDHQCLPVVSDQTWRVKRSGAWRKTVSRLNHWIGYREIFYAENEDHGWKEPGFDDGRWDLPDIVTPGPAGEPMRLVPRDIPFLRETEALPVAVLRVDRNGGGVAGTGALLKKSGGTARIDCAAPGSMPTVLLDFGKTVVGYPQISIGGNKGGTCVLSYGESLDLHAYDRLILDGKPLQWSPFGRRAFRYMQLSFYNGAGPIELKKVALRAVSFPVEYRGSFTCSDPMLNRIWEVGRYTVQMCMQDHFEDCPTREQALWVGDVLPGSRVAYYAFGESGLTRKCLLQTAHAQKPAGWIPAVGPMASRTLIPNFCAYWVSILYEYFLYSGDRALLEVLYPQLRKLMRWFTSHRDAHGLLIPKGRTEDSWWCFIDWAKTDKEGEVTALQCVYYKALLDAAAICDILHKPVDAATYRKDAAALKLSINERLWDDHRIYIDCRTSTRMSKKVSVQTNMFALLCDIAAPDRVEKVLKYLSQHPDVTPAMTPFMNGFVAEALFHHGREQEAVKLIREYWGEMLSRGATTFWEMFNSNTPHSHVNISLDENHSTESLCHGWSGGPTHLLPAYVLGITPTAPMFKRFKVRPHPANLKWAKGRVPTPLGDIDVSWKLQEGGRILRLEMAFPKTCRAQVELPCSADATALTLNGKSIGAGKEGMHVAPNIRYIRTAAGRVFCEVLGGGRNELILESQERHGLGG